MNITVATLADIPQLNELLGFLFTQEAEFQPDAAVQSAGLRKIIENPDYGEILVLRDDASIIGMVNLLFTISTALGSRVAILEDMVVHPSSRGGGAGSQLLQAAIKAAKSAGCRRITLLTDGANAPAQCFYQRHGFVYSDMVAMRLLLSGS
ncbi:MAG: GNAT family N-acetyltransferase [Gammaproteobacteria bacterium]